MCASDDTPSQHGSDNRSQPRSSIFLAAVMRAGMELAPVKVRNMSSNGAMVEGPLAPIEGTAVELIRGSLIARGTVRWRLGTRLGLSFSSEVSVKDWLAVPTTVHQQRVDEIVALAKAGRLPKVDPIPAGRADLREERTDAQLIDDLATTLRLIADLEDELASSDETLARHGQKLQNLDIAMQMLRAVIAVLTPGGDERVSFAKLEDLRVACAKALGS